MIKSFFYAILLGIGMATCMSERNSSDTDELTNDEIITSATTVSEGRIQDPSLFVIAQGRVGNIKVGMPVQDMRQQVSAALSIADTMLQQEGRESTAYHLRPKGERHGLLIEQQCQKNCRVWRINVNSQEFKTAKGIGVGSKYDEVQQLYPISHISQEEGQLIAVSEKAGISFILSSTAGSIPDQTLTPSDIPANTIVKSLLVY